jgi:hypothetical protein
VRGPANWSKAGAYALEGVVETDWSIATFTMNWRLTHLHQTVQFDEGEPICMIVPQRRGELERFQPTIQDIQANPELYAGYEHWRASRKQFMIGKNTPGSGLTDQSWQKHYFQGAAPNGLVAPEHQLKLNLRDFSKQ